MTAIRMAEPFLTPAGGEIARVQRALRNNRLSHGVDVEIFETAWANYVGVKYALACSSGTAALHLALKAIGVGPGTRVAVPTLTYVATANAVRYCGGTVVLHDVDPFTWTMVEPEGVDVSLPVHLFGVPATAGLKHKSVVEDACEAHGAHVGSTRAGALGSIAAFSFYANKIITTGEGGMVTTNDRELADRVRHFRAVCTTSRYRHDDIGFNYRMTNLQGAIGVGQVETIHENLRQRRTLYQAYDRLLFDGPHGVRPGDLEPYVWQQTALPNGAPWVFPLSFKDNAMFCRVYSLLDQHQIETRPFFTPLHRLPMYRDDPGKFPAAERLTKNGSLLLPLHPRMTEKDVERICALVKRGLLR